MLNIPSSVTSQDLQAGVNSVSGYTQSQTTLVSGDSRTYCQYMVNQTGALLFQRDLDISGALQSQMGQGGITQGQLDSLSGWSASMINLTVTGSTLIARDAATSGQLRADLAVTGAQGWIAIITTSGNVAVTGATLIARDLATSGVLDTRLVASGAFINTLTTNLTNTGATVWNALLNTSGNLATTGAALDSKANSVSGWAAGLTGLSATGQAAWTAGQNNALNLSGALTQSGVTFGAQIAGLSGIMNSTFVASGALLSAVKITGSSIQNSPNFTGAGTVTLYTSGSFVFISGSLATGITQSQLDLLSGWTTTNLTLTGSTVWNALTNTSGNLATTGNALSANLSSTGATLWQRDLSISGALQALIAAGGSVVQITGSSTIVTANITGIGLTVVSISGSIVYVSGAYPSDGATLSGSLTSTGTTVWNALLATSGNLSSTGSNLQTQVTTLTTNLTATGATIWNALITTSGNLSSTGSNLQGQINTLTTNLTATGATVWNALKTTSGNLATTGSALDTKINALSGYCGAAPTPLVWSPGVSLTWTSMPTAPTFFNGGQGYVTFMDLGAFTGVSLVMNKLGTAGTTTGGLYLGYLDQYSVTASSYKNLDKNNMRLNVVGTNTMVNSGYQPIVDAAKSGVYVALLGTGGNGNLSPIFGMITAFFK